MEGTLSHRSASAPGPPPAGSLARIETELGLRDYQRQALRGFVARGGRGIAHMATGTGKTLVGIGAILWAREAGHRALIVLPTRALVQQWTTELVARGGFEPTDIVAVTGSSRLRRLRDAAVVLTTVQTARRNPDALTRMVRERDRTLIIVDECHRAGAPQFSNALVEAFPYRLGLSATPERPYDPVGTRRVLEYFDGVMHEYELGTAVDEGYLAPYTYHVHSTYLYPDEAFEHDELTRQIAHLVSWVRGRHPEAPGLDQLGELLAFLRAGDGDGGEAADQLQELLFARARIVKNARGKVDVFRGLCDRLAGKKTIVFSEEIDFAERLGLAAHEAGLDTFLYHSLLRTGERDRTLEAYRAASGGVLLAVRALDEGLDVPDADVAVLAASSTSRRQHIQRRGRVLRPLQDKKKLAELHDFYVVGVDDAWRVERIREDAARVEYHGFEDTDRFDRLFWDDNERGWPAGPG